MAGRCGTLRTAAKAAFGEPDHGILALPRHYPLNLAGGRTGFGMGAAFPKDAIMGAMILKVIGRQVDVFGKQIKLIVTFGMGGILLVGFAISIIALPVAILELDYMAMLGIAGLLLSTTTFYYYFRVAAFIWLKLGRRGCREASFDSVLVDGPFYYEFYMLHLRLDELTERYRHLLSNEEISRAARLARRHRVAAWVSITTFVSIIVIAALLATIGVLEPTG
jgi:hypothetical protein